ncbi:MAG: hypothetical protein HQK52_08720 [Oligoflexia bacterium]|nr:hypothetical protein [Oligoflexia bacterium]
MKIGRFNVSRKLVALSLGISLVGLNAHAESPREICEQFLDGNKGQQLQFVEVYFRGKDSELREVDLPVKSVDDCISAITSIHTVDGSSLPDMNGIDESDIAVRAGHASFGVMPEGRRPYKTMYIVGGVLNSDEKGFAPYTDIQKLESEIVNDESDTVDAVTAQRLAALSKVAKEEYGIKTGKYAPVLDKVAAKIADGSLGFQGKAMIGPELEFFFMKADGSPVDSRTAGNAVDYYGHIPADMKAMMQFILQKISEYGVVTEKFHHEVAPGQYEIPLKVTDAVSQAKNLRTTIAVVERVAKEFGLSVNWDPKPFIRENGSGMHMHFSITSNEGKNLFARVNHDPSYEGTCGIYSSVADQFFSGLLSQVKSLQVFSNPLPNSEVRLGKNEAPAQIAMSVGNRTSVIRLPIKGMGTNKGVRGEKRSPDAMSEFELTIADLVASGLYGITNKMAATPLSKGNAYEMNITEEMKLAGTFAAVIKNFMSGRKERMAKDPSNIIDQVFDTKTVRSYLADRLELVKSDAAPILDVAAAYADVKSVESATVVDKKVKTIRDRVTAIEKITGPAAKAEAIAALESAIAELDQEMASK